VATPYVPSLLKVLDRAVDALNENESENRLCRAHRTRLVDLRGVDLSNLSVVDKALQEAYVKPVEFDSKLGVRAHHFRDDCHKRTLGTAPSREPIKGGLRYPTSINSSSAFLPLE